MIINFKNLTTMFFKVEKLLLLPSLVFLSPGFIEAMRAPRAVTVGSPKSLQQSIHQHRRGITSSQKEQSWYKSSFKCPTKTSEKVLVSGQILAPNEKPFEMVERIVRSVAEIDKTFDQNSNLDSTEKFSQELGRLMDEGSIVFSTPIMTNAGRFNHRPLSACVVPPIDLRSDMNEIKKMVDQYHEDGMGTGYDLSEVKNPVEMLKFLNKVAVEGAESKREQRPVGNMATLDVKSSHIEEFIMAKVGSDQRGEEWKFNISVNITDEFMDAVKNNAPFTLNDGKVVSAKNIFEKMAFAAHQCGDPGLLSLDRLNKDNPTPLLGAYKSTAPCAEVGLAPGETCIFGYINLAQMVDTKESPTINYEKLRHTVNILTRALDDILELSIKKYSIKASQSIMQAKRKIGIGICGFADMLIALNISYIDQRARDILQDVLNYINLHSKLVSMELAKSRGPFMAIFNSKYMDERFLLDRYEKVGNTPSVHLSEWQKLAKTIKETKMLRHAITTALPPTGRSALVIGASTGIEPLFSLNNPNDGIYPPLRALMAQRNMSKEIMDEVISTGRAPRILGKVHPFITATEIDPLDHLAMAESAQKVIDESISKTINLPEKVTPEEIAQIYLKAYESGLKGMSVYRDNCRDHQPKNLSTDKK